MSSSSSSESPPVGSNNGGDLQPIVQSDIWYSDGNAIIQVQFTRFRVHASILSQHSPVIGDMLKSPTTFVDGSPVVFLTGDSVKDVHHLLSAMYVPGHFNKGDNCSFELVAAMLRLGKKYEIKYFHDEAKTCLAVEGPTTIEAWDDKLGYITFYDGILFDMVNLARECDVLAVLPGLFCRIIKEMTIDEIFGGIKRLDGSASILSIEDQKLCILGLFNALEAQTTGPMSWLSSACNTGTCAGVRQELLRRIWRPPAVLMSFDDWADWFDEDFCGVCRREGETVFDAGRRKMWEELPSYFGLPGWFELCPSGRL